MDKEVLNAIKNAISLKEKEVEFYKKASEKTKNPSGRKVFGFLADDEAKHLKGLKRHLSSFQSKETWLKDEELFDKKVCKLKRSKPKSILPIHVKDNSSDIEALTLAIEIEKKSIEAYTDAACGAKDKKAEKIFHFIIEAEKEHLKELELQYAFLKSEGFWYDNEITLS